MTYCLAMRLDEGLIFLADTRTNAGVDNVGTYRKLHLLHAGQDRVFVLESAGNLATTHEVLDLIDRDLNTPGDHTSLATVDHLFEAALYIGELSREVVKRHREGLATVGADATSTFVLGGQIAGDRPDLFLVYPEGNYIRVSDTRPFFQIGETKYGKFMLELAVHAKVGLDDAVKIALSSMLSTARANLSVGPPFDLGIYRNGSLKLVEHRIEADSEHLQHLHDTWLELLTDAIDKLPPVIIDD
ncbi:20S proteasome subunit A/B [Aquihabitans daechungensis]|uniref:20S proteasome subunit A/B n=1 Tax=Aquihabitans daechungensis TaxID=1052257 RepID=UPI003B9E3788